MFDVVTSAGATIVRQNLTYFKNDTQRFVLYLNTEKWAEKSDEKGGAAKYFNTDFEVSGPGRQMPGVFV